MALSLTDMKILKILQDDARVTNQELAEKISLSASPCWRKVRKLEEDEVIQGYRAVLDRKKIGFPAAGCGIGSRFLCRFRHVCGAQTAGN